MKRRRDPISKKICRLLAVAGLLLVVAYGFMQRTAHRHQSLEGCSFLTGERVNIPLSPIKVYYSGGDATYFETEMALDEMLEKLEAAPGQPLCRMEQYDDQSALLQAGRSYYLLYRVSYRAVPFHAGTTWYFFDMGATVQRRTPFQLVFPFHLTRSDAALCPPDNGPIVAGTPYRAAEQYSVGDDAKARFMDFYRGLGQYQMQETEDGFRLLGYGEGVQGQGTEFPVTFHFSQGKLWLE